MLYVKQSHIERVYNETLENEDCLNQTYSECWRHGRHEVSGLPHQGTGVVYGVSRVRGCITDRYKHYS